MSKPKCQLSGTGGNVFALSARVTSTLKNAGLQEKADEFSEKLFDCKSYAEALKLMNDYVDIQ